MGSQHYSLRWNNHQSHVLSAFDALLQNESLVDCTLVCEDTSVRAHKVVLSACSPYFQKIFTDNPCKHPIIVLKDIRGWEVQCIVDFMYKGETSVPETQLTGLIKAAESLKVRGLTSTDQHLPPRSLPPSSRHSSPMPPQGVNGYHCRSGYSPSPARYPPAQAHSSDEPHSKLAHLAAAAVSSNGPHSNQSSPISLTSHDTERHRASSPGHGSGPRRKQARPRRRSGDSTGNASLDLSKSDSPSMGFRKSPSQFDDATPENLSMKRPSSSPAMNLVKTESMIEEGRTPVSDTLSEASSDRERDCKTQQVDPFTALSREHLLHSNGLHHVREHEALQALNFMATGGGLSSFPPGHPLAHPNGPAHLAPSPLSGLPGSGSARPTSTPTTPTNAFAAAVAASNKHVHSVHHPGLSHSLHHGSQPSGGPGGFEFQRISIDRSKMSEEEAFEHAIEMIQTRQMGFRKAADFFSVSKWKLYKTARKRGIYAEIKKQNQAQALTKVPTNVQHFADLGVYKQLKKKTHLTKDVLFPHLPGHAEGDPRKVFKTPTNNNTSNMNNNNPFLGDLQKKLFPPKPGSESVGNPDVDDDLDGITDEEDDDEEIQIKDGSPIRICSTLRDDLVEDDDDLEDDDSDRALVINHRETDADNQHNDDHDDDDEDDSSREDSA